MVEVGRNSLVDTMGRVSRPPCARRVPSAHCDHTPGRAGGHRLRPEMRSSSTRQPDNVPLPFGRGVALTPLDTGE